MPRECLSEHDRQVLDSIFNPLELTSSAIAQTIQADDAGAADLVDIEDEDTANAEHVQLSISLELSAVKLAEKDGKLEEALRLFEQAITAAPERPSPYNNRAQALRLAGRDDEAFADLNRAIDLAVHRQLRTKCHAHCQRGVLFRKRNNLDDARSDFEQAAKMGSKFARAQLVEINPFAALCNQMLRQAFEQLK